MVMFYTKELVEKLAGIFNEIKTRKDTGRQIFDPADMEKMESVIDDLFGDV